jgi:hypothetical protein
VGDQKAEVEGHLRPGVAHAEARHGADAGRSQVTLLPEYLDDYIAEDNPLRVVDVFVDELRLHDLGFEGTEPAETGRPSYHPAVLLKIYIYGQTLGDIGEQMKASPDGQISLTDPDARSMATSGRGTGIVGYNVQTAVDAKHHMIVAHEVTNVGHDRGQLADMAVKAQEAVGEERLIALADRGYYEGYERATAVSVSSHCKTSLRRKGPPAFANWVRRF